MRTQPSEVPVVGPKAFHLNFNDDNLMKLLVLMNFCLYMFQVYKEYFNHMFSFSRRFIVSKLTIKWSKNSSVKIKHSTQVWSQAQEIKKIARLKQSRRFIFVRFRFIKTNFRGFDSWKDSHTQDIYCVLFPNSWKEFW